MNNKKTDENLNDRACIIIRSAGERTEFLCKELVLEQGIPKENISVIRETPFTRALKESYEAGIAINRQWTLCLDADVLLRPGSIHEIINLADNMDASIFEIQGLILDKFFGGSRNGGIHLYRTSLLNQALECVPREGNIIRPEWHTLEAMKSRGFPWKSVNYLTGLHDFEQYYKDIFRKCFVQAHKHLEYSEIFLSYWPQQGSRDLDYKIALDGFFQGINFDGDTQIDAQQETYYEGFKKLQVVEKPDLQPGYLRLSDIENIVESWIIPPVYHKYIHYELISAENESTKQMNRKERLIEKKKTLGLFNTLIFLFGWGLVKIGDKIKGWVDSTKEIDH